MKLIFEPSGDSYSCIVQYHNFFGEKKSVQVVLNAKDRKTAEKFAAPVFFTLLAPLRHEYGASRLVQELAQVLDPKTMDNALRYFAGLCAYMDVIDLIDRRHTQNKYLSPIEYCYKAFDFSSISETCLVGKKVAVTYSGGKESEINRILAFDLCGYGELTHVSIVGDKEKNPNNLVMNYAGSIDVRDWNENLGVPTADIHEDWATMAWASKIPNWYGRFLPWILLQRLCVACKYYDSDIDYIITGDEFEAHDIYKLSGYPYLRFMGIDFAQSQHGNNLLNYLFLNEGKHPKLVSTLMNFSELQTFAIAMAKGLTFQSCWADDKWCNQCSKCYRMATLYKLFGHSLPVGLEFNATYAAELDGIHFLNNTSGPGVQTNTRVKKVNDFSSIIAKTRIHKMRDGVHTNSRDQAAYAHLKSFMIGTYPKGFCQPLWDVQAPYILEDPTMRWFLDILNSNDQNIQTLKSFTH